MSKGGRDVFGATLVKDIDTRGTKRRFPDVRATKGALRQDKVIEGTDIPERPRKRLVRCHSQGTPSSRTEGRHKSAKKHEGHGQVTQYLPSEAPASHLVSEIAVPVPAKRHYVEAAETSTQGLTDYGHAPDADTKPQPPNPFHMRLLKEGFPQKRRRGETPRRYYGSANRGTCPDLLHPVIPAPTPAPDPGTPRCSSKAVRRGREPTRHNVLLGEAERPEARVRSHSAGSRYRPQDTLTLQHD